MQKINHKDGRHIVKLKEKKKKKYINLIVKTVRRSLEQSKITVKLHDKKEIRI